MLLLTAASLPLFSITVRIVRKEASEYDSLGLFRFPVRKNKAVFYELVLRPYQPGDSPGRVHWKITAKTGELTVREERCAVLPGPRAKPRAAIPVALCLSVLLSLFPPWKYGQQMAFLQRLLLRPTMQGAASIDLRKAGPVAKNKQAVLDVVVSETQMLYLRGQAFEIYDGRSWSASDREDTCWPKCDAEGAGTVTIATRTVQPWLYFPYYIAEGNFGFARGGIPNTDRLQEYTYRQQRTAGIAQNGALPMQCLQLPEDTRAWAESILRQELLDEGETVKKIQYFVRNCAKYDKNTMEMSGDMDFARWFMEGSGRGYCVHFATAAAVLLRCAGIPARFVTGYAVNVQAGVRKTVVQEDAHAWVEYLDGGIWRILEATPVLETVPLPELPAEKEITEEKEQNYGFLWVLVAMVIIALQAWVRLRLRSRWDSARLLGRLLGEDVSAVEKMAQKAAYSRYGLTPEEWQMFDDWQASAKDRLEKKPWYLRAIYWLVFAADIFPFLRKTKGERKGPAVKQEEKKPINWEVADPKPPIIRSGKMENRKQH